MFYERIPNGKNVRFFFFCIQVAHHVINIITLFGRLVSGCSDTAFSGQIILYNKLLTDVLFISNNSFNLKQ